MIDHVAMPYHLFFASLETQDEYRDQLDAFLDQQRVEEMKQSVHALGVKFWLENIDVFAEMWSSCQSLNILSWKLWKIS